jgi:peptidoglycan DL-endopeptidase CwlO
VTCRLLPGRSGFVLFLLAFTALTAVLLVAGPARATGPIDAKKAEAQQVYDEIISLDQSLSVADEKFNQATIQLAHVKEELKLNHRELVIARRNLGRGRMMVQKRLVSLYTSTSPSTLDLILGAQSIGDLLTRLDNANRLSDVDSQVVNQVLEFKASVTRHAKILRNDRAYAERLVAQRRAIRASVASRLAERQRLLSSIKDEISRLVAQEAARRLQAARAAAAQIAAAQAAQAQSLSDTVVGASASTPEGATVVPASAYSSQVVSIAMSYLGVPYVWGGASPGGFDCSGLVMYAYAQIGVSLPHSSYAQANMGTPVPYDQLQPGDLVFFDGDGHVGMYIGGGEYVNAPHTGAVVRVESLGSDWASSHYDGARRIT